MDEIDGKSVEDVFTDNGLINGLEGQFTKHRIEYVQMYTYC